MAKRYSVNDVFYSIQGEGQQAGRAAVFVRFAGCNLQCAFCDTDHARDPRTAAMTAKEIVADLDKVNLKQTAHLVLTGGEPGLQVDSALIEALHRDHFYPVQVETNGTMKLPRRCDWITCSPKPAGRIVLRRCDELKVVIDCMTTAQWFENAKLPRATYKEIMPVYRDGVPDPWALAWCTAWVLEHPNWCLTGQYHKLWGVK